MNTQPLPVERIELPNGWHFRLKSKAPTESQWDTFLLCFPDGQAIVSSVFTRTCAEEFAAAMRPVEASDDAVKGCLGQLNEFSGVKASPLPVHTDVEAYPLKAHIWKRGEEWVLEISGSINNTYFTCRHVEPETTAPEDVAGLPSLYGKASPLPGECKCTCGKCQKE